MIKLLIVEDETDVREFMANFFRKRNVEVMTASSGSEALKIWQKEKPYLILLDIQMPDMDGIQTLRQIREKDKDTKVIMVTAKSPDEENALEECRRMGAMDYIHKPLELDALEKKVMKELGVSLKDNVN